MFPWVCTLANPFKLAETKEENQTTTLHLNLISELRGDVSGSVARLRRCDTFRLPFRGSGANLQSADITMGNIEK